MFPPYEISLLITFGGIRYTIHFRNPFLPNLLVRWWDRQDVEAALQSFYEAPTKVVEVGTVKTVTPISSRYHRDFIDFTGKKWDFTRHIQQISACFPSFGVGFHMFFTTGLPGIKFGSQRPWVVGEYSECLDHLGSGWDMCGDLGLDNHGYLPKPNSYLDGIWWVSCLGLWCDGKSNIVPTKRSEYNPLKLWDNRVMMDKPQW